MKHCFFFLLIVLGAASTSHAAPRFANVFGDHAVLQRDSVIRVWGSGAEKGKSLRLRLGNQSFKVETSGDGYWEAKLSPQMAESVGQKLELLESDALIAVLKDVVFGDVWVAAGQSNMQFQCRSMVKTLPETKPWLDLLEHSNIRVRQVQDPTLKNKNEEARDLAQPSAWSRMNPLTALSASAVALVFARELEGELEIPIGIIDVSWGGKPIEPFIPRELFTTPLLKQILDLSDQGKLAELAQLRGGVIIRNPEGYPAAIFNARMSPLTSYAIKGFIWYQAESNSGSGEDPRDYRFKQQALAEGWRSRWQNPQLPFYYVQLPSYPPATGWIRMREEQRRALKIIPNSGMAVTIDIRGEGVHPPDKIAVGKRLARLALRQTYGREQISSLGPSYRDHRVDGSRMHVRFDHADGGLMIGNKPGLGAPELTPNTPLKWFELAGADGTWHPAQAFIEEEEVIVQSKAVPSPREVRYACHSNPQGGNLYNRAGLPASPFCSNLNLLRWEDPGKM